ncbi:MAG TPA: hypothetical protein VMB25_24845 [Bryobacteraceae bacterium]|nr:hypothetical protein [Bryobacteraceae bacterium]
MRRLLTATLFASSIWSVGASAQYAPAYGYRDYNRGDLFDRVQADLDRVESASYWNGGDRHRIDKVRGEVGEFQRGGRRHALNDAIGALQKVVNDNRMPPRDREILAGDLNQMRDYRARMGWH